MRCDSQPRNPASASRRVAGCRQQMQPGGEQQNRQYGPEEIRHGDEQELHEGQCAIGQRSLVGGGPDAERDTHRCHQDEADGCEDRRSSQRFEDERRCWPVHHQRLAKVAMQHRGEPAPVLQPQRVVQAEFGFQRGDRAGRRVFTEDRVGDVAGKNVDNREDQQRHRPDGANDGKQATDDIPGHATVALRRSNQRIGWVFTPVTALR